VYQVPDVFELKQERIDAKFWLWRRNFPKKFSATSQNNYFLTYLNQRKFSKGTMHLFVTGPKKVLTVINLLWCMFSERQRNK
jgi:hypothetical protein